MNEFLKALREMYNHHFGDGFIQFWIEFYYYIFEDMTKFWAVIILSIVITLII